MNITISGTRATNEKHEDFYHDVLRTFVLPMTVGDNHFYVGGAQGWDHEALKFLLEMQAGHKTTIVVPKRVEDQPRGVQGLIFAASFKHGAHIHEMNRVDWPSASSFYARNDYMLDRSEYLFACPLMGDGGGGTRYCIKGAIERDMPRTVIPIPGGDASLNAYLPISARRIGAR